MLQSQRSFSGSNVARASGRWNRRVASVLPTATKTPYPDTTRDINTDAPTDVVYDAVIVGGRLQSDSNSSSSNRGQPVTIATMACLCLLAQQLLCMQKRSRVTSSFSNCSVQGFGKRRAV